MLSREQNIMHIDPLEGTRIELGDAVCAIGVFDGMHIGHREIFALARKRAAELGIKLYCLSFDQDPDEIFRTDDPKFGKLLSNKTRLKMIAEQAPDGVISMPVNCDTMAISPEEFLAFLGSIMTPRAIYTGVDFHFGAKAKGSSNDLACWSSAHDCEYIAVELVEYDGEVVSSTRIRNELRQGHVASAKQLLAGRPHSISGTVVHGRGQGEGFGFATANLDVSQCEVMLPCEGVYGCYAVVDDKRYPAAVNVGVARSFDEATAQIEAHLLDFSGNLYGKEVTIEFEEWLREPRVFSSREELINTVMGNINWVLDNLKVE